ENTESVFLAKRGAKFQINDRVQSLAIIKARERIGHGRIAQFPGSKAHGEVRLLQSQKRARECRKILEIIDLRSGVLPNVRVEQTKSPDHQTRFEFDRGASVGPQVGRALYIRQRAEFRMSAQIRNSQNILRDDH